MVRGCDEGIVNVVRGCGEGVVDVVSGGESVDVVRIRMKV